GLIPPQGPLRGFTREEALEVDAGAAQSPMPLYGAHDAYRSSGVVISTRVVGDTQECRFWATYTARVTKLLSRYTHGA
ncbi:hypothetical protein ACTHGN_006033, partial [Pseudomonas putida]